MFKWKKETHLIYLYFCVNCWVETEIFLLPLPEAESDRLSEAVYRCACTYCSVAGAEFSCVKCLCVFHVRSHKHAAPCSLSTPPDIRSLCSLLTFFSLLYHPSFIFQMWDQRKLFESRLLLLLLLQPPADRRPESHTDPRGSGNKGAHPMMDVSTWVSPAAQIWGVSTEFRFWDELSLIATIYADGESPINNIMINHRHYFFHVDLE